MMPTIVPRLTLLVRCGGRFSRCRERWERSSSSPLVLVSSLSSPSPRAPQPRAPLRAAGRKAAIVSVSTREMSIATVVVHKVSLPPAKVLLDLWRLAAPRKSRGFGLSVRRRT